MVVKLQLQYGRTLRTAARTNRQLALIAASLLSPASLMAIALGFWRLCADLNWMDEFAISTGLFSHWQVWIALGILMQFGSIALHRYVRNDSAA
jgi:hypothetical protein